MSMSPTRFLVAFLSLSIAPLAAPTADPPRAPAAKGRMTLTFTERHPHGGWEEFCRRTDVKREFQPDGDRDDRWDYDITEESFEVFVPATYRRGVPHGLFVWISPTRADLPSPKYFDSFRRHKLIWVSANDTGNNRGYAVRAGLALDAAHNMKSRYEIDEKRVYVSGFSGGGSLSAKLVRAYPEVFDGAFCIEGGSFVGGRKGHDGKWEPAYGVSPWNGPLESIKKDTKLVLMYGRSEVEAVKDNHRRAYEALLLDGFRRVSLFEIPKLNHFFPSAAWFERGVAALEAPPKKPPTTAPTVDPNPTPAQIATARRLLVSGRVHLDGKRTPVAVKYLRRVVDEYPTTPAADEARGLLDDLNATSDAPQR